MDTARQILRFSIPGSLLFLHGLACLLLVRLTQGEEAVHLPPHLAENSAAIVAVLATIPIGFVVYQVYYFSYGPVVTLWPRKWGGRIVHADRGWLILSFLEKRQIQALEAIFKIELDVTEPHRPIANPGPWYCHPLEKAMHWLRLLEIDGTAKDVATDDGKRRQAFGRSWHRNWSVLHSILDIAGSIPGGQQIKHEYTTLSDIYHALGAARIAITIAGAGVFIWTAAHVHRFADDPVDSALALVAIAALTAGLNVVMHVARRRTWSSAAWSLRFGLRWLFWRHADEFVPSTGRWGREALRNRAIRDALRSNPPEVGSARLRD